DKAQARQLAKQAGVPVVPGSELPLKDAAEAVEVADRIGYPIIFKAAAGGGGRGMRIVRRREDVAQAFDACQSEAGSAFGSGEIYCEKYVEGARHVEVDRKSTRLNSSHGSISYAVFCLKKRKWRYRLLAPYPAKLS